MKLTGFLFLLITFNSPLLICCNIPTYLINLDLLPKDRWTQVATDYSGVFREAFKLFITDEIPKEALTMIEIIASKLDHYFQKPYAEEMQGIAHSAKLNLSDVVLFNILYEITAFCTSITTVDIHNNIWHARNFDYGNNLAQIKLLKNMTIFTHFTKGGKVLYSSVTLPGYIGIHTGIRPKGFSITVNERDQGVWTENLLAALSYLILNEGVTTVGTNVRSTLENVDQFENAVSSLASAPLIAPVYFTISGIQGNEGVIITRGRMSVLNIRRLHLNNTWYILETNYDPWTTPPPDDDRRHPAIKAMESMGRQNISTSNLMKVLSTPPVCNDKTIFSVIMGASNPSAFQLIIRK